MAEEVRPPMCGICLKKFEKIEEGIWMGVCEHRAGVVAHIGSAEKKKRTYKKK